MRLPLAIYFILAATVMASAVPDRTTRRGLKAVAPTAVNAVAMRHDTVTPSPGMIDVAGYDKPLRSRDTVCHQPEFPYTEGRRTADNLS